MAIKIVQAVREPIMVQEHALHVTAGIGIAIYPINGTDDARELMRKADMAMYAAKEEGRNGYRFYHG